LRQPFKVPFIRYITAISKEVLEFLEPISIPTGSYMFGINVQIIENKISQNGTSFIVTADSGCIPGTIYGQGHGT
jgi:hypothetical protein